MDLYKDSKIDAVLAVESRGFVVASPLCYKLGLPLVLARKKREASRRDYISELCSRIRKRQRLKFIKSDIKKGSNVLIIDDLIATGGT